MANRKVVGLIGGRSISGNPFMFAGLSPGGFGAGDGVRIPTDRSWGTLGWVALSITTSAGAFVSNHIITGASSGARARVIRSFSQLLIVERLDFPSPATANWFRPLEAITSDVGGASGLVVSVNEQASFSASGTTINYDIQAPTELQSTAYTAVLPSYLNNIFFDRGALLAQNIAVTIITGSPQTTLLMKRVQGSVSGATGLCIRYGGSDIDVASVTGAFQAGEDIVPLGGGAALATTTGAPVVSTRGEWVPYTVQPNLRGVGVGWDDPPAGSDTSLRLGLIGMEPYIAKEAVALWGTETALFKLDSGGAFPAEAGLGGVTYGVVPTTGTTTGWTLGETLTASGGWSAKLVAYETSNGRLHVKEVVGTLAASATVTGSTSGKTATSTDNCLGWMKGAKYWVQFWADVANGQGKRPSDTWTWKLFVVATPEGDSAVPTPSATSLGYQVNDFVQGAAKFARDLREETGNDDLVVVDVLMPDGYRKQSVPNVSTIRKFALRQLTTTDRKYRVITSDEFDLTQSFASVGGFADATDPTLLESLAYPKLGRKAWQAFRTADVAVTVGTYQKAPIVALFGQSQMVGTADYNYWLLYETNPELGKVPAMPGTFGTISTLDARIHMWNCVTAAWETYDMTQNAVSFGSGYALWWGPEATFLRRLADRYGEIWCIKVPYGASSMQASSPGASGTWEAYVRPQVVTQCTVSASGGVGTFTATGGTPFASLAVGQVVQISGALTGSIGIGGNNTAPYPTLGSVTVAAVGGGGASVSFVGAFLTDAVAKTVTFDVGPVPVQPQAERAISEALASLLSVERRTPHVVATATWQGESDVGNPTGYQAACEAHIDWVRDRIAHRIGNELACPHLWLKLGRLSPFGTSFADVDAIRAAQDNLATTRDQVAVIDTTDLFMRLEAGTWPRSEHGDWGTHVTPIGSLMAGERMNLALTGFESTHAIPADPNAELLAAVSISGLGPGGVSLTDFLGGDSGSAGGDALTAPAGSLIVEDGTGLADADSYVEASFVSDYLSRYSPNAAWDAADPAQQEVWCRVATKAVDDMYSRFMRGTKRRLEQRLDHPRIALFDDYGYVVPEGTVAPQIREATAILAGYLASGELLLPDSDGTEKGGLIEQTQKADGVGSQTFRWANSNADSTNVARRRGVEAMLWRFFDAAGAQVERS